MTKRLFDIIFSFLGIIFLFLPFLILVLIIKFSSKGSVFFLQTRVGYKGKLFKIIKFRTMYLDSEKLGTITTATDFRITPIGEILRRHKLDELPQLWNIFIGKMSFVGPRPDVPGYADKLEGKDRKILELRPGITGPATLCYRNEEEILAKCNDSQKFNDEVIWPKKVELNLGKCPKMSYINLGKCPKMSYINLGKCPITVVSN